MNITNLYDLSTLTELYGEDFAQEALDNWFESNSNECILIKNGITCKIDMSSLFPTSNREQAYNHFVHFSGITIGITK